MVYPTLWAFWTKEVFGWNAALIGMTLSAYGIAIAITQGGVMRILIPRLGEYKTLMFSVGCALIAFLTFGLTASVYVMFGFLFIAALSDMAPPTMTAIMANLVSDDRQGLLQGVIASLASVAAVIAPLILTAVFGAFSGPDAAIYFPGAPFILAAVLIIALLPLILRFSQRKGINRGPKNQ